MLLDDRPLIVLPTLAIAIGVNEAIALQQLHWLLCDPANGKRIAEHQWIFNTVEQWRVSYFPFWSERTIRTVFTNLSRMNLIVTCQPEGRASRRKYYRVNTEKLPELLDAAKNVTSKRQPSSLGKRQESSFLNTKTSSETSNKESEETPSHDVGGVEVDAEWKPIAGTKEEQLRRLPVPSSYPSEEEFDRFIEDEQLDHIGMGKRSDLYESLCAHKWQHWGGRRWTPIRDWRAYVRGLERTIAAATGQ